MRRVVSTTMVASSRCSGCGNDYYGCKSLGLSAADSSSMYKSEQLNIFQSGTIFSTAAHANSGAIFAQLRYGLNMFISRPLQFVHQVYSGNNAIRKSHCPRCYV